MNSVGKPHAIPSGEVLQLIDKKRILLVDSKPGTRELLSECVLDGNYDYEITVTSDGEVPWGMIESRTPDIIVIGLEGVKAWDLLKKIRVSRATRETPIIMLHAEHSEEIPERVGSPVNKASDQLEKLRQALRWSGSVSRPTALGHKSVLHVDMPMDTHRFLGQADAQESDSRQLDLMIHSSGVKNKLISKLNDLRPYLNPEGKSKLGFLTRQLKWELNVEEKFSLEKEFDARHAEFYDALGASFSALTRNEKRLCAYFMNGHSATDIARITTKSLNCVNVAFARIRSKMRLKNKKDLLDYLLETNAETRTQNRAAIPRIDYDGCLPMIPKYEPRPRLGYSRMVPSSA